MARSGKLRLLVHDDNTWEHIITCPGESYSIDQTTCDARQPWKKACSSCKLRIGGKEDPRATKTERDTK